MHLFDAYLLERPEPIEKKNDTLSIQDIEEIFKSSLRSNAIGSNCDPTINSAWVFSQNTKSRTPVSLDLLYKSLDVVSKQVWDASTPPFVGLLVPAFILQKMGVDSVGFNRYVEYLCNKLEFSPAVKKRFFNLTSVRFFIDIPENPLEKIMYDLNWAKLAITPALDVYNDVVNKSVDLCAKFKNDADKEIFRSFRCSVYQTLLKRKRVFATNYMEDLYGQKARDSIRYVEQFILKGEFMPNYIKDVTSATTQTFKHLKF